jgi:hypothetical protein
MSKHRIVVSAENNPYMAWQCKLFYFSCRTRLNQQPIIIVHDTGTKWRSEFYDLAKAGCSVHGAPNYRTAANGDDLPGRNHAGSLIKAAEICDGRDEFIALCDPDMIFVRETEFLNCLSAEFSSFMDYDRELVQEARMRFGIQREELDAQKQKLSVAVPYVIPSALAAEFGRTWLQAIDLFPSRQWEHDQQLKRPPGSPVYERRHVVMYAFGLTVVKLGREIEVTHLIDHNFWPDEPARAPVIHYAYGDERWNKRHYFTDEQAPAVWYPQVEAAKGTILGELLSQLRQAGEFYRDPYFARGL